MTDSLRRYVRIGLLVVLVVVGVLVYAGRKINENLYWHECERYLGPGWTQMTEPGNSQGAACVNERGDIRFTPPWESGR